MSTVQASEVIGKPDVKQGAVNKESGLDGNIWLTGFGPLLYGSSWATVIAVMFFLSFDSVPVFVSGFVAGLVVFLCGSTASERDDAAPILEPFTAKPVIPFWEEPQKLQPRPCRFRRAQPPLALMIALSTVRKASHGPKPDFEMQPNSPSKGPAES
jgi:hypothetical protein